MSKIEEANAHIQKAEKSLKTSFMKWKPDFDVAADEYTAAATCFKIAKSYKECKDCFLKAADCCKQNRSWFHAAKSLEQAILISKEIGDFQDVQKLAHSACSLYQQHGSPESGVTALDKAAKLLEAKFSEQALELYRRAADVASGEDSPRQAAEYMSKVARLYVRLENYDKAADAIRREIGMHQEIDHMPSIGRLAVALVLVQLARCDSVAAEKAFKEWGNCCEAEEVQTLQMLLEAFDNEDANSARSALNSPFIKHMDVEYAKLARSLLIPQQEYAVPPAGVRPNAAPSYISPNASKLSSQATIEAEVNNEEAQAAPKRTEFVPEPEIEMSSRSEMPEEKKYEEEEEDEEEGNLC